MDAEEVFLSCTNLTLGQYRIIVLARGLTGAVGCVVSLAVFGIVLLTTKKRAWESWPKRIYLATVLYTLLYSIMAIATVNYSHPPSQESTWCEAMGFLLHYTGTLVIVHYSALALTVLFQVIVPVYQATRKKPDNIHSSRNAKRWWEVILFLILFFCPLLNTWEPFLPQLPSYGNYGPLCWFRLELTDNCTTNKSDELFLVNIPFAVVCFGYCVLTFTISLALCRMHCKFRTKTIGNQIITVIPTVVVVTVLQFIVMLWFILSAIPSKSPSQVGSFSEWLRNVTVTTAINIGTLVAVGVYIHFPIYLCRRCKRALHQEGGRNEQEMIHPPDVAHHNTETMYIDLHSPVTTVAPPQEVGHRKYTTHTTCNIAHSPLTTECTALISTHPPEVDHHKYPTHTTYSISHEPVTTTHN